MRRAQRIVQLEGEVVLRAIEWREERERFEASVPCAASDAPAIAMAAADDRLFDVAGRLVQELEQLTAVPS